MSGVLAGKNVIQDLANSGLIPRWFDNKSCLNVQDKAEDIFHLGR